MSGGSIIDIAVTTIMVRRTAIHTPMATMIDGAIGIRIDTNESKYGGVVHSWGESDGPGMGEEKGVNCRCLSRCSQHGHRIHRASWPVHHASNPKRHHHGTAPPWTRSAAGKR